MYKEREKNKDGFIFKARKVLKYSKIDATTSQKSNDSYVTKIRNKIK